MWMAVMIFSAFFYAAARSLYGRDYWDQIPLFGYGVGGIAYGL